MSDLDLDALLEDAADRRAPDFVELIAEVRALRRRVATLEVGIRDHRDKWPSRIGDPTPHDERLWSLLDASRPSVAEMAGSFEGGPDSVEWLRKQRADQAHKACPDCNVEPDEDGWLPYGHDPECKFDAFDVTSHAEEADR